MELTKIFGNDRGSSIKLPKGVNTKINTNSGSANITHLNDGRKVIEPIGKNANIKVNNKEVRGKSQLKHGDLVSIGDEEMYGVHKKGINLSKSQISNFYNKTNISADEIDLLTEEIFNIKKNKAIQKPLSVILIIFAMTVFFMFYLFIKMAGLNRDILESSKVLELRLSDSEQTIENLAVILGYDGLEDCEINNEDCQNDLGSGLDEKIITLNKRLSDATTKVIDIKTELENSQQELITLLDDSLSGSASLVLRRQVIQELNEKYINSLQEDSENISRQIKVLKSNIDQGLTNFKSDMESYNAITDRKVEDLQLSSNSISERMGNTESDISTIESGLVKILSEIKNLDIRLKNLEK